MSEYVTVYMWRSEANLQDLVWCFHSVGSGDQTRVIKCLYLLRHLSGLEYKVL